MARVSGHRATRNPVQAIRSRFTASGSVGRVHEAGGGPGRVGRGLQPAPGLRASDRAAAFSRCVAAEAQQPAVGCRAGLGGNRRGRDELDHWSGKVLGAVDGSPATPAMATCPLGVGTFGFVRAGRPAVEAAEWRSTAVKARWIRNSGGLEVPAVVPERVRFKSPSARCVLPPAFVALRWLRAARRVQLEAPRPDIDVQAGGWRSLPRPKRRGGQPTTASFSPATRGRGDSQSRGVNRQPRIGHSVGAHACSRPKRSRRPLRRTDGLSLDPPQRPQPPPGVHTIARGVPWA